MLAGQDGYAMPTLIIAPLMTRSLVHATTQGEMGASMETLLIHVIVSSVLTATTVRKTLTSVCQALV